MYILNQKLKHLKNALKLWNKTTFGDIHSQVKIATNNVNLIQDEIDSLGITDELLEQEKNAQLNLEKALQVEETLWQHKSKVNWFSQGDRNTTFFHRMAKIRNVYLLNQW
jgi:hypothetical protein